MDLLFPFGFPASTMFYLSLFVATLVLHVVFMNYVLAGSAWLAIHGLRRLIRPRAEASSAAHLLQDWMAPMLSGAITAGVAPLLFVQVLYKTPFYTANLLLFHRWMLILPVLIVGFYFLYVLKSTWLSRRPLWVAALAGAVPFACIAFTGYSWTENHLLSVRSPEYWVDFYERGSMLYVEPQILPRLAVWAFGAIPTLAAILGLQLRHAKLRGHYVGTPEVVRLARIALIGLGVTLLCSVWYVIAAWSMLWEHAGTLLQMCWLWLLLGVAGVAAQVWGWRRVWLSASLDDWPLLLAAGGCLGTIVGMSCCRESVRLVSLGRDRLTALYDQHLDAAMSGGFWVFVVFALVNAVAIAACFWIVRRGRKPMPPEATAADDGPVSPQP